MIWLLSASHRKVGWYGSDKMKYDCECGVLSLENIKIHGIRNLLEIEPRLELVIPLNIPNLYTTKKERINLNSLFRLTLNRNNYETIFEADFQSVVE